MYECIYIIISYLIIWTEIQPIVGHISWITNWQNMNGWACSSQENQKRFWEHTNKINGQQIGSANTYLKAIYSVLGQGFRCAYPFALVLVLYEILRAKLSVDFKFYVVGLSQRRWLIVVVVVARTKGGEACCKHNKIQNITTRSHNDRANRQKQQQNTISNNKNNVEYKIATTKTV